MFINLLITNYISHIASKEITRSRHSKPSADLCKRLTVVEDLGRQNPHSSNYDVLSSTTREQIP